MPPAKKSKRPSVAPAPVAATRRRWLWLAVACLVVAAIAGWTARHLHTRAQRTVAVRGVAPRPDLRGWATTFGAEIAAAENAVFERGRPADGLARLAALYHANGFYPEAQQAYAVLRKLQPREAKWWHRAAHLHASLGEASEAIALWRQTLALAPDYIPARIGLGETLFKSGQTTEAGVEFSAVLAREPDNVYAQLGLARLEVDRENWSSAQTRLEEIARRTERVLGADLLATVYERSGAPERGAALRAEKKSHGLYVAGEDPWIDELMDACFDAYRLALESGTAAYRKDMARAETLMSRALELDPNNANLHFHAAQQARQRGALDLARTQLETAVRLDPALTDAWGALVSLLQQQGQLQTAAHTLERGLAANPDSPVLLLERGRYHKTQGRTGAAMADFRRVAQLRHDDATASIELARLLLVQNRLDEGIRALEQGLAAEPGQPIALSILTFAAIQAGRQELADRCLRQVVEHPRVTAAERSRLLAEFQKAFGRSFSWPR